MSAKTPSMKLDKNFMHNVLALYDELIENGISVVYIGQFTHQVVKMFTEKNEEEMETPTSRSRYADVCITRLWKFCRTCRSTAPSFKPSSALLTDCLCSDEKTASTTS